MNRWTTYLRHGLLAVVLCLATAAFGQDWLDQGGIKSREYKKEIRGAAGVEATEFFTLEYSVAIKIEEVGKGGPFMHCRNECQGKKHKKHEECDRFCDTKCPERDHKMTIKGEYRPDLAAQRAATAAANGLAVRGGGTVSPNDWSHRVSTALAEFRNACKKKKTFTMPHADQPCANRWWQVGTVTKTFSVKGTMRKVGYRMSRGVRTPIDEVVGTHEQTVASGDMVLEDPIATNDWVDCRCREEAPSAKEFYSAFVGALREPDREELTWRLTNGGVVCYDAEGNLLFGADIEVDVSANDLNTVKLVIRNRSGQTVRVVLPPGTFFLPADPLFQVMCAMVRTEATLAAGDAKTLYVNVGPPPLFQGEATIRWACMEMAKKEPNPGVKYRIQSGHNDGVTNLAAITARSRFRGPHDQARVWIFTDHASREEINKRMIPGVSPAVYAILLRDVAVRAGADFTEKSWNALVQPNLLDGMNLDDKTVYWLVEELAADRAKELGTYIDKSAPNLAQFAAKEGEDGAAYVAWIATALFLTENLDLSRSAGRLLAAVPPENKVAVARAGGLDGLRSLLTTNREAECALALDIMESYGTEGRELAMACLEALPTDTLKARAAKLTGVETAEPAR